MISKNKCSICESINISKFSEDITYCNNCNNFFRDKISDDIYKVYLRKLPMPTYFDARIKAKHHLFFLEQRINFDNINSIVEIGPGDGELAKLISNKYPKIRITLIEPGEEFIKKLKKIKNTKVINSFIEEYETEENFDLVILSHVLEHLISPEKTLKFIYENWMDKGNKMYIDIPNADYELRSIEASITAPKIHLTFFRPDGIYNLLLEVGFDKAKITGNIYSTLPRGWINRQEKIGKISKHKNKFNLQLMLLKILNHICLICFSSTRYIFQMLPPEKQLTQKNKLYNNIAIISEK